MEAAGKAGERLKSATEERGLTSEGLKEVAGEVADTFKDAISGKSEDRSGAAPGGSATPSSSAHEIVLRPRPFPCFGPSGDVERQATKPRRAYRLLGARERRRTSLREIAR
jgi:hypothetical protein